MEGTVDRGRTHEVRIAAEGRREHASLCREFGISRVTGYKIFDRYKECGLEGLTDLARTPYRYANKLPAQLEAMIVSMRREKPTWGARKLRDRLLRKLPNDVRIPACSTIHAIMDRHGVGQGTGRFYRH
jgi:putative transposase